MTKPNEFAPQALDEANLDQVVGAGGLIVDRRGIIVHDVTSDPTGRNQEQNDKAA